MSQKIERKDRSRSPYQLRPLKRDISKTQSPEKRGISKTSKTQSPVAPTPPKNRKRGSSPPNWMTHPEPPIVWNAGNAGSPVTKIVDMDTALWQYVEITYCFLFPSMREVKVGYTSGQLNVGRNPTDEALMEALTNICAKRLAKICKEKRVKGPGVLCGFIACNIEHMVHHLLHARRGRKYLQMIQNSKGSSCKSSEWYDVASTPVAVVKEAFQTAMSIAPWTHWEPLEGLELVDVSIKPEPGSVHIKPEPGSVHIKPEPGSVHIKPEPGSRPRRLRELPPPSKKEPERITICLATTQNWIGQHITRVLDWLYRGSVKTEDPDYRITYCEFRDYILRTYLGVTSKAHVSELMDTKGFQEVSKKASKKGKKTKGKGEGHFSKKLKGTVASDGAKIHNKACMAFATALRNHSEMSTDVTHLVSKTQSTLRKRSIIADICTGLPLHFPDIRVVKDELED